MRILENVLLHFSKLATWLGGAFLLGMMLHVSVDVLSRYIANQPFPMTLEIISKYYMPAVVFLPLGLVTQRREHLEVELFTNTLKGLSMLLVNIFCYVVGAVFVATLAWRSALAALQASTRGELVVTATHVLPVWPARWFLPLGCALTLLWLLLQLVDAVSVAIKGQRTLLKTTPSYGSRPLTVDTDIGDGEN